MHDTHAPTNSKPIVESHTGITVKTWLSALSCAKQDEPVNLEASGLTISRIIAIAILGASCQFLSADTALVPSTADSVSISQSESKKRAEESEMALFQRLHTALVPLGISGYRTTAFSGVPPDVLPLPWVRAMIVVRAGQALSSPSGIQASTVQSLIGLLTNGITPLVPSIGTTDDLTPLAFLAGAVSGTDVPCHVTRKGAPNTTVKTARLALSENGLTPVPLGTGQLEKLINGTACSLAVATILVVETNQLALLTQLLSAFAEECLATQPLKHSHWSGKQLLGTSEREVLANIQALLNESRFPLPGPQKQSDCNGTCISVMTAQRLGPHLDNLRAAATLIKTLLKKSDNGDLMGDANGTLLGVGRLDAPHRNKHTTDRYLIADALDKVRQAIVSMGHLLLDQCSQFVDSVRNNNLPASLAGDCPTMSSPMKGVEATMAAYMTELSYLAAPVPGEIVGSNCKSAIVSARKTGEAIDVFRKLAASHIYVLCQAADLRMMQRYAAKRFRVSEEGITAIMTFRPAKLTELASQLSVAIPSKWDALNTMNELERIRGLRDFICKEIIDFMAHSDEDRRQASFHLVLELSDQLARLYRDHDGQTSNIWLAVEFVAKLLPTPLYLTGTTSLLYRFIRHNLKVPFHRGLIYDPLDRVEAPTCPTKLSCGAWITRIYEEMRNGQFDQEIMKNIVASLSADTLRPLLKDEAPADGAVDTKFDDIITALSKAEQRMKGLVKQEQGPTISLSGESL